MNHPLRLAAVAAIVIAIPLALLHFLPNSVFYSKRSPTRAGRLTNRFMAALYGTRATPRIMSTLEVRKRRDGGTQRLPIVIADHDGGEFLVSMLGHRSEWVKNVFAAGGEAVIRHGDARPIRLIDVPVEQRAPILRAYVKRALGARPHFPIPYDAPLADFEALAAEYPVFRIEDVPAR